MAKVYINLKYTSKHVDEEDFQVGPYGVVIVSDKIITTIPWHMIQSIEAERTSNG